MKRSSGGRVIGSVVAALVSLAAALSCGGSDAPTSNAHVQIANYTLSPTTVDCGPSKNAQMIEVASPDTMAAHIQVINTTSVDVTDVKVDAIGIVATASDPADIGKNSVTVTDIPYTPKSPLVRAKDGDVTLIVSVPMGRVCNTKQYLYKGQQEIQLSLRVTTSRGVFITPSLNIRVNWDNE